MGEFPPRAESTPDAEAVAAQLQLIAAQLWSILTGVSGRIAPGRADAELSALGPYRETLIAAVEAEYDARRMRDMAFDDALFGEPAWDMLLYLYAAQLKGDLVATTSLARASAVPPTTALRWMAQLERIGLIERCAIKRDGRVRVQRLTRRAIDQLERHFRARLVKAPAGGGWSARLGGDRDPRDAVPSPAWTVADRVAGLAEIGTTPVRPAPTAPG